MPVFLRRASILNSGAAPPKGQYQLARALRKTVQDQTLVGPFWIHRMAQLVQATCVCVRMQQRRKRMKSSTEDKVEGGFHEVKGKVKEKVGQVTNNPNLEDKGTAENLAGKVQKKVGQIKKVFEK